MKAAIYTRVSTDKQAEEDKVSLDVQVTECRSYCDGRGYSVVEIYTDAGFSGATKNRPAFRQMLKDAGDGMFDVIVCWKSDRISRGLYPATALMMAIEGTTIRLEAVKDNIDLNTFGILAAVGKIELENIKQRVSMGARGRVSKGKVHASPKYGYQADSDGYPAINDLEAPIVERIFSEYIAGNNCDVIAASLNQDGVATRRNAVWRSSRVWDILRDGIYTGTQQWGKRKYTFKDNGNGEDVRHTRKTDDSTWIDVAYPPIITHDTFRQATECRHNQQRIRAKNGNNARADFPLRSYLWCGVCGCRYSPSSEMRNGKLRRRYICTKGAKKRSPDHNPACLRAYLVADKIEKEVFLKLYKFLSDPAEREAALQRLEQVVNEGGSVAVLVDARLKVEALEGKRLRLTELYTDGLIDRPTFDSRLAGYASDLQEHRLTLASLESSLGQLDQVQQVIDAIRYTPGLFDTVIAIPEDQIPPEYREVLKDKPELASIRISGWNRTLSLQKWVRKIVVQSDGSVTLELRVDNALVGAPTSGISSLTI